ncbi:MAG: methyltransferase domain-containing protein [Betaproteobacteria bacterium]
MTARHPPTAALLAEQIDYYRARASEYDAWWLRQGRYDRGAEFNAAWFAEIAEVEGQLATWLRGHRPVCALELACGTGLFTRRLAPAVGSLTAIDASPEVIAINRARIVEQGSGNVDYAQADLFAWHPAARYELVFMSFWLSHVPMDRFDAFWETVAEAVAPGGAVYLIDSAHDATSTAVDHVLPKADAGIVTRMLENGSTYRIVKHFWTPQRLTQALAKLGWTADIGQTPRYFVHGVVRRGGR